jgi:FkbM family methyltransferase
MMKPSASRITGGVFLVLLGIAVGIGLDRFLLTDRAPAIVAPAPALKTELDRYLPKHFSERNEEVIIRHFFQDRTNGLFLDVGAYHYKDGSNTYYLEKNLGWKGIAIDANGDFAPGYRTNRPGTTFLNFFVSDKSDLKADFYIVRDPGRLTQSTGVGDLVAGRKTEKISVPTITLDDILSKLGVQKIDFLSMDIELWEPRALAGFNIGRFRPDLVCIEANSRVRDQIWDYFAERGYVRLNQYLLFDRRNWYFAPDGGDRDLNHKAAERR